MLYRIKATEETTKWNWWIFPFDCFSFIKIQLIITHWDRSFLILLRTPQLYSPHHNNNDHNFFIASLLVLSGPFTSFKIPLISYPVQFSSEGKMSILFLTNHLTDIMKEWVFEKKRKKLNFKFYGFFPPFSFLPHYILLTYHFNLIEIRSHVKWFYFRIGIVYEMCNMLYGVVWC